MKVTYRVHAVRRMFEHSISEAQVREVLEGGEEITAYPDDKPYPSRLLLGWQGERPLHVAAYNAQDDEEIVITVYEPEAALWEGGFKRRRS